jgi:hypothetical protein
MSQSAKKVSKYSEQPDCQIGSAEDFYHVEQLRHLLGNKLTLPLTVLGHLRDGKRVSRRTIERAICNLQAITEQFEAQPERPAGGTTDAAKRIPKRLGGG